MKPGHAYYEWKVRGDDGELYTPHGDPMYHEFPFDFQFENVGEAYVALDEWGIVDQYYEGHEDDEGNELPMPEKWHPEDWVLVRTVSEVVE